MLSYCLKMQVAKLLGQKTEEQYFHQNLQCVIEKIRNSSKSKKLVDH